MKLTSPYKYDNAVAVVPFVGTWIEIRETSRKEKNMLVVPFVGTWIEISRKTLLRFEVCRSYPSWVRGLKWFFSASAALNLCRTLRGYVD